MQNAVLLLLLQIYIRLTAGDGHVTLLTNMHRRQKAQHTDHFALLLETTAPALTVQAHSPPAAEAGDNHVLNLGCSALPVGGASCSASTRAPSRLCSQLLSLRHRDAAAAPQSIAHCCGYYAQHACTVSTLSHAAAATASRRCSASGQVPKLVWRAVWVPTWAASAIPDQGSLQAALATGSQVQVGLACWGIPCVCCSAQACLAQSQPSDW